MEEYFTIPEFNNDLIYENEIIGIEKILADLENDENVHIYLRMHPNLKNQDNTQNRSYQAMAAKFKKNFFIIPPESKIHSEALLEKASIVIVFGSTIGLQASYLKKPVIIAMTTPYDKIDVGYKPKSHQELLSLVRSNLMPKNPENALKYAFWEKTFGISYKRFEQTGLHEGLFLGKRLVSTKGAKLIALAMRIYEILTSKYMMVDFLEDCI